MAKKNRYWLVVAMFAFTFVAMYLVTAIRSISDRQDGAEWDYGGRIDDLESEVESVKSDLDDVRSEAEDAQYRRRW